jgi:tetratricopeptide (TPR) repeat protein
MGSSSGDGSAGAGERAIGDVLRDVRDDREFEFELRLTHLAETASPFLLQSLRRILEEQQGSDLAFAALYASHIYFRRMKEYTELRELMATFGDSYRTRPTYSHLKSLSLGVDPNEVESAAHCAKAAKENAPRHPGVLHNFAMMTIQREETRATPDPAKLAEARRALDTAITQTHGAYARYHATYARLLLLEGEYARAEEEVDQAIDREEPTKADYAIRIGEYQAIKLDIKVRQSMKALTFEQASTVNELRSLQQTTVSELERIRGEIDGRIGEARADAMQLLGLLAAVVAFVVSASSIAAQLRTFAVSGRLFVTVAGAILVIYAGFSLSFLRPSASGTARSVAVLALGIGIGAFALFGWHVS